MPDLRYAARNTVRNPGFAALAILTIALGAGAATAVFSVVDAVLLRPLPYPHSERLLLVWETRPATGLKPENVTPQVFHHWRRRARSFDSISAAIYWTPLLRRDDRSERRYGLRVSSNMFTTLSVQPALGRVFLPEEDADGAPRVAILGDRVWRDDFSANPSIIGRTITLDGLPHTVVGVMPPGFRMQPAWASRAEIWTPLSLEPRLLSSWRFGALRAYARLKPNVSQQEAQRELDGIAGQLNAEFPADAGGRGAIVESLRERTVGNVRSVLLLLLATVGCVMAVACANLANLLLIRASRRDKELAIRTALGASRWNIAASLVGEALIIGLLGSILAVGLAAWIVELLPRLLPVSAQSVLPRLDEIAIDLRIFAFAVAAAIVTAALATLAPAIRLLRTAPQESLQQATRSATAGRSSTRLRSLLIAGEAALTLVLLCGAALLLRSFGNLLSVDPGFRVANTLTFVVTQPRTADPLSAARLDQLRERLAAMPGVHSAALVNHIPVAGDEWGTIFHIPGVTSEDLYKRPRAIWRLADRHYLKTMGITLRSGRDILGYDQQDTTPIVLINEVLASRWFPNRDAVGKAVLIGTGERRTIAGVFSNTRQAVWGEAPEPEFIQPLAQNRDWRGTNFMSFVLHTAVDPTTLIEAARRGVAEFDQNQVPYDIATMDEIRSAALGRPRFSLMLLSFLAAATLALAVVGLFAVVSYSVASRTREFGIRSALGADSGRIHAQIFREGLRPVATGAAIGLAISLLLMRQYRDLLYRVDPHDPIALLGALALILSVTGAACWLPARRASCVPPATVLRNE